MRIMVVLAHPDDSSLNHAIAREAVDALASAGHEVAFHDLYAEGFDPLLPAGEIPRDGEVEPAIERHSREVFGDPLEHIWRDCVFGLCGVEDVRRRTFSIVVTSTREERRAWLAEVRADVLEAFPSA